MDRQATTDAIQTRIPVPGPGPTRTRRPPVLIGRGTPIPGSLSNALAGAAQTSQAQFGGAALAANCDPHYSEVCIAPPPLDLDCAALWHRDFRVLRPDPHCFGGDEAGIGCES